MTTFNLKPSECLILEDNENGIRAARASGAHLLIINTVEDTNFENIQRRIAEIEGAL
jgi:beta-phosphoglucomutase-like phosphatase (HAD superfamily)